jgi:hypothetical protein
MKVRVRMRGPENGGAKEGTPEIYVTDPDGIQVQLQDPKYGGGAGVLGDVLKVEPSPKKGLIALEDFESLHDLRERLDAVETKFYQDLFGMGFPLVSRADAPTLAIGSGSAIRDVPPAAVAERARVRRRRRRVLPPSATPASR